MAAIFSARAFVAGNKRTALAAATQFLEFNGYEIAFGDSPYPVERLWQLFEGRFSQAGAVDWFRLWMLPIRR
jgi:prophage maintenance system killer protein